MSSARENFRKALKGPDAFQQWASHAIVPKLKANQKLVLLGAMVLVIAVVVVGILGQKRAEKIEAQAFAYQEVLDAYRAQFENSPSEGAEGEEPKFSAKAQAFLKEHPEGAHADSLRLLLAYQDLRSGKTPTLKDISHFSEASLPLKMEAEGMVAMEAGDHAKAQSIWTSLVDMKNNPFRSFHAYYLGLSQEAQEDWQGATQTYERFETEFAKSKWAEKAKNRLRSIGQNTQS